jgi:sporulation protein YlmC with PRC-barrel domain
LSQIDLALKVLDHQLLDGNGRRCGNVDDLEIDGGPGEEPRVTAIVVGRRRGKKVRVPWEEVADVDAGIVLRKPAEEYGLGRGDDRVRTWIEKLPGAGR